MVQQWSDQDGFSHVPKDETKAKTDKEILTVQWTWPSTVAFISLLAFVGFIVWVFFG